LRPRSVLPERLAEGQGVLIFPSGLGYLKGFRGMARSAHH
jgi:hypothetical protein